MQAIEVTTAVEAVATDKTHKPVDALLLYLPVAGLRIVQAGDTLTDHSLERAILEPKLLQVDDGTYQLRVRQQGTHGKFEKPYIGTELVLVAEELGLVAFLISYHGTWTEKHGKRGYIITNKGQFWRFYQQRSTGEWCQISWWAMNDALREEILTAPAPLWAKRPGKLATERKPPAKMVEAIGYKVVRVIDGRYYSLQKPEQEYILGERVKQVAKPNHGGGFFSYPTLAQGREYLASNARCFLFADGRAGLELALIECEVGGRIIPYGRKRSSLPDKCASTYLCPIRVLETRFVSEDEEGDK